MSSIRTIVPVVICCLALRCGVSLRTCLSPSHYDAPAVPTDHWTLGERVPITVTLENEAGVRVRDPHSHRVWTEPESTLVRRGMEVGIPLRVALEGEQAGRFLLDVTSCIGASEEESAKQCQREHGLVLDLKTGTATGVVAILPTDRCDRQRPPGGKEESVIEPLLEKTRARGLAPSAKKLRREEKGGGGNEKVSLFIAFSPEWMSSFNRPVLPLGSLPAPVFSPPSKYKGRSSCGVRSAVLRGRPPPFRARESACNVRRLRFAVNNGDKSNNNNDNNDNSRGHEDASEYFQFRAEAPPPPVIELSAVESVSLGGFFGTVWDCSLALSSFLAFLGPSAVRGKRVVELGAGCGVVSAVCAFLGASEVVATDTADLLPLLTLNLQRSCSGNRRAKVEEYNWGSPIQQHTALAGGDFDLILCSDLLFDPAEWDALRESLCQLGGERSVVYLAHRTRNVQELDFFGLLERGGATWRRKLLDGGQGKRVSGCMEGMVWRREYFPDVALYELSPIRAGRQG